MFTKFSANDDEIIEVHAAVAPGMALLLIAEQYDDIMQNGINKNITKDVLYAESKMSTNSWPQSGHVCQCASHIQWIVKDYYQCKQLEIESKSSTINHSAISDYLYVNLNMLVLASFDCRPAVNYFLTEKNKRIGDTPKADRQKWYT